MSKSDSLFNEMDMFTFFKKTFTDERQTANNLPKDLKIILGIKQ